MSVGTELAAARERLGLSREDVSKRTKISVERLLAIEQEDLPNLPPLVYLRGFVREYATAVQLDPDQVTQRYLLEFDEPAGLIAREPETADEAAVADSRDVVDDVPLHDAERPPIRVIPPRAAATDLFESEDDLVPERFESEDDIVPEQIETAASRDGHAAGRSAASRYDLVSSDAAPTFGAMQAPPRGGFRGGFIAVALAVLAGILIAAYGERVGFFYPRKVTSTTDSRARTPSPIRPDAAPASHANDSPAVEPAARATNTRPIERPPEAPVPEARAVEPSPTPATPSTAAPQLRAPAAASPSAATPRPSVATPSAATPAPEARVVPAPPPRPAAPSAAAPVDPPAPAATTPSPRATVPGREATAPSSDNLTGNWSLTTRIEMTDVAAFENMNLGFRLQLQQDGERIAGRGIKWMENGKLIPERSRTSIFIGGIRRGNRLELRFTEHGTARTSTGTFVMDIGADGTLHGQFASTSANSSGSTIARRATPEER